MFGLNGNGKSNGAMGYAKQAVTGFAAGFAIDAIVEALDIPFLNDTSAGGFGPLAGGGNISNIELIQNAIALLLSFGGLYALMTKQNILGIKGEHFFLGTGIGSGQGVYEAYGAKALGLRS